jgi:DNA modification methylase
MIIESLRNLAVPIDSLQGLPGNPRVGDVDAVAASLDRFGQRKPIVVRKDDGTIIAGNHTWQAAKKLGWAEIAVAYVGDDDVTAQAYALADNRTAELGSYDEQALKDLIDKVAAVDPELVRISGWSDEAVQELLDKIEAAQPKELNEDVIPEVPEVPVAKPGDIWQLGNHRLMCGDSTDLEVVEKLMDGKRADICFTSPPYNAGSLNVKNQSRTNKKYNSFNDNQSEVDYGHFIKSNLKCIFAVSDEILYNIGLVEGNKRVIVDILTEFRNEFKDIIYWKKSNAAPHIQPGIINNLVEFIICFGDGKRRFKNAQFSQGTYWNVIEGANASENEYANIHKATFPQYLPENIIANFCPSNGVVLDTFGGVGTTLIAAEKLERNAYLMELDPKYCDVIVTRWENLTGKKAVLINAEPA